MSTHISVNNKTTVHKQSTGKSASFPDVCKTPSPGGPVPIPYPNLAQSSDSGKTTKKVKVQDEGANQNTSVFTTSAGDEAGTAGGGVVSSTTKGKAEWKNSSFDVKFEGKKIARLGDPMGTNASGMANSATMEAQPPKPGMGANADPDACKKLKKKQIPEDKMDDEVEKCGMAREHADAMRGACVDNDSSATVRSSNRDCMNHVRNGHPAKGTDVKQKTISDKSLGRGNNDDATLEKVRRNNLRGLVGDYDDDGNLRGVMTRGSDGKPTPVPLSDIPPTPSSAFTGDYDLHDMFGPDGSRIHGAHSAGDTRVRPQTHEDAFRHSMNESIRRGEPGDPSTDMVRHGPQANYFEWAKARHNPPDKKTLPAISSLMLPDVSEDEPLLHFDQNGEVYKIEDEEELRLLYACKGADTPESWDWSADQWEEAYKNGEVNAVPDWVRNNKGVDATKRGMDHVRDRHTRPGEPQFSGKSKFDDDVNVNKLISESRNHRTVTQPNGRIQRTYDAGREIGDDATRGHRRTSTVTVITEPDGTLVTAFPGRPGPSRRRRDTRRRHDR